MGYRDTGFEFLSRKKGFDQKTFSRVMHQF